MDIKGGGHSNTIGGGDARKNLVDICVYTTQISDGITGRYTHENTSKDADKDSNKDFSQKTHQGPFKFHQL